MELTPEEIKQAHDTCLNGAELFVGHYDLAYGERTTVWPEVTRLIEHQAEKTFKAARSSALKECFEEIERSSLSAHIEGCEICESELHALKSRMMEGEN